MNFKYLCQQYNLGRFLRVSERNSGTVARVWELETDAGTFLVRTLKDKAQGVREWELHRRLRSCGFAAMPTIVVPYREQGALWVQVQEYITGVMPNPALPGMAAALAAVAKELSRAMPEGLIHGDLGPWNMVQRDDGRLMVIDFGEAAPGDPYFDYAALLGGVINHTPEELRELVCGDFLRELDCDRARLLEQLCCWAEQGTERWTGKSEKMVARFDYALNWAKEHIYDI